MTMCPIPSDFLVHEENFLIFLISALRLLSVTETRTTLIAETARGGGDGRGYSSLAYEEKSRCACLLKAGVP
jgi:hypothetical protein